MKITEEQIKEAYERPELLKELFPDVFKTLEIGKWYKNSESSIYCITSFVDKGYNAFGINFLGYWRDEKYFGRVSKLEVLATHKEVKEALIKEAKNRGFKEGFTAFWGDGGITYYNLKGDFNLSSDMTSLFIGNKLIFEKGIWAEIIEQPLELTLDQVAEKFNVKSVKIIK